jgi:ubiquinone/menaquinone biosynthesis C-methylase UbiE
MLPRTLEPEVMDEPDEARDYDAMDHAEVNRLFVRDFLELAGSARLGAEPHVLDVGTGTAQIPLELCRHDASWRVTAVDLSHEMLKLAERNVAAAGFCERVQVVYTDARRLPFPDGRFPAVMSNSIVHHIAEPGPVLAEMRRVLRPGGVLFVRDLLRPQDEHSLERLVAQYAGGENEHSQAMFRASLHAALTLDEVRQLLAAAALPPEWVRQTSDRHWTAAGIVE